MWIDRLCRLGLSLSPWHLQRGWNLQPEHEVVCPVHLLKLNRRLCSGVHSPVYWVHTRELLRRGGVPDWDVRDRTRSDSVQNRLLL
jgi:hypothetical protein